MPPIGTSSQQTLLLDDFETAIDEILSQSGSGETRPELCPYPDSIFPRISRQLELANKATWSLRPRTYTVLRLINRLDALNGFIAEGLFDISLPYTGQTLPTVLKNPSARAKFLEHQHLVLSPQAASVESNEHPHRHFSDDGNMHFVPIKKLGSGAYGQVDHVWSRLSANEYARKRISRGRTFQRDKKAIQDFEKELRTLKKLSHRHLVSYVGSYTDPKYVAILMAPVADMNLMEYLKIDPFPIDQLATLRHYFGCLASALVYLHANKIRHKDIKPHNILVHLDNILISDFGTSLDWSDRSCSASQGKPATFSPKYCAPEVREHMIRGSSADIYSLGYVFLEMLTVLRGQSLEKINDIQSTVNPEDYPNTAQRAGELWIASLSSKLSCTYDDEPLEWIADMLRVEPKERPSAQELLNQIQLSIGNFIGSCCADGSEGSVDSSYAGSVCSMMPTPKQREYAMSNPDTSKNGITAPTEFHSYEALSGPESPSSPSNGDTVALREVPPSHRTQAQDRQGDNSTNSQTSVLQKLGNSATNPNLPSKEFSTDNIAFALTAQERFVMAVKTDDVPTMRRCLEQGADVNFPDSEGRTALFHAAFEGSCPAIAILLSEGADATLKANDGWTALHGAAFQGHKEAVMLLLHSGADVNQRGCYEPTAFMYAIENGHIATAQVLLDNGGEIDTSDVYGDTPISRAARFGQLPSVRFLLESGVNVNSTGSNSMTSLHRAAYGGHLEVIELLLERGAIINSADYRLETPLHHAAYGGHLEVIELLLERGANINSADHRLKTPLHLAAYKGYPEVVRLLLEKGTGVDSVDNLGITPLHNAAARGHLEVIELLLERGANINSADHRLKTPLHLAAYKRYPEVVQLLLERDANVNSMDDLGITPLYDAAAGGHLEAVKLLLERGAEINSADHRLKTPLHLAAYKGYPEVVQLLLERGAGMDSVDDLKITPLHNAAARGHFEVVKLLLERGAKINSADHRLKTPLHLAAYKRYPEVVQLLLERGANINSVDDLKITPLYDAAAGGHLEAVKLLLERGAEINSADYRLKTPLHLAAYKGYPEVVQLLLERGAGMDSVDNLEITPLHNAAAGGHLEVVKLLLERGVEINSADHQLKTPLHLAAYKGHLEVVQLLLERGVSVNSVDGLKMTPLHDAAARGHFEVVKLLLERGADVFALSEAGTLAKTMALRGNYDLVAELIMRRESSLTRLNRKLFSARVLEEAEEDCDFMEEYIVVRRVLTGQEIESLRNKTETARGTYHVKAPQSTSEVLSKKSDKRPRGSIRQFLKNLLC